MSSKRQPNASMQREQQGSSIGSIRVEHHALIGDKRRLGPPFQDVRQLGDALLYQLQSLLQIYDLPHDAKTKRSKPLQVQQSTRTNRALETESEPKWRPRNRVKIAEQTYLTKGMEMRRNGRWGSQSPNPRSREEADDEDDGGRTPGSFSMYREGRGRWRRAGDLMLSVGIPSSVSWNWFVSSDTNSNVWFGSKVVLRWYLDPYPFHLLAEVSNPTMGPWVDHIKTWVGGGFQRRPERKNRLDLSVSPLIDLVSY